LFFDLLAVCIPGHSSPVSVSFDYAIPGCHEQNLGEARGEWRMANGE
jgi:hypothetical protein